MTPPLAYDTRISWEDNCLHGPRLASNPPPVPQGPRKCFLGLPVCTRIGIAAGLLPNRRWILPYATLGFGILTYKTVRSSARPSYPAPNWVFVDDPGPDGGPVTLRDGIPEDRTQATSAVCFGMPSPPPEVWRSDIRQTRDGLPEGHPLIVSVVGTPGPRPSIEALAEDFARCAAWADEAGADIIEANLSCPNVCSGEGSLHLDKTASLAVATRIRGAIGHTPLLLKVGLWENRTEAGVDFLRTIDGVADGVTLANAMSRPVLRPDGTPVFGDAYRTAGVIGRALHGPSVRAVREFRTAIETLRLSLKIAAVGGVSTVDDFGDFFEAGADAVLCGSSPAYLPGLAAEARRLHPEW